MHPCLDADFNFLTGADMIPTIHHTDKLLYEQIYEFYKAAILQKRLAYNQRLPSYRVLAKELGIANNTVLKAYEQLVLEGYVTNVFRKGLYVTKIDRSDWQLPSADPLPPKNKESKSKKRSAAYNTSVRLVDESHFPVKQWRKCSNWALDRISFQYQEYEQDDPLKEQLIKYLFQYRGVRATPARLLIGSGASSLVFWLAFVLRNTCKKIIVEEPGYTRTRFLFQEFGYNVKPIRVTEQGIDLLQVRKERGDLLYVTPSHQYPTGVAIPVSHRIQLLNWAQKNNAYIIEDDFDCEFRYKTNLMPSLQGLDQANRVIYIGTFSSALMPSLRVAYMVLPENFGVAYESYQHLTNTVPYFTRRTLALFMEKGFWERHLKKMRTVYKRKYDACMSALQRLPENCIEYNQTPSGLNILLHINTRLSEKEIIQRAKSCDIEVTPTSGFYSNKTSIPRKPQVLFEFGSLPQEVIGQVVEKLYKAWFE
ncbi:GntR family transcriptional regulator / MocR family aminotransferase [Ohtaekwangia koreensis]|uniref:GntR family transcriptional regulator / MocR family aminotransferase n=2 Tax=Ohtaekwangia koreensis TaxID=688867 RepID=A0A1T5M0B2_9BACT|nr:GntR family transcriptional regulator / MocR family aminotransferase [Ohtaekwangia koreensis]